MTLLRVTDLRKLYPVAGSAGTGWRLFRRGQSFNHALDGVSFTLARGEALGLVGESGCGKSTLAALVARLADPTSGTIHFDGLDIGTVPENRFSRAAVRPRVQMVFQDAYDSLDPRRTVSEAIAVPLARLRGLRGPALDGRVAWALDRVHLGSAFADRLPHQLSGGQLARVAIARAIAPEPELLVLDEPTSALDVSIQAIVLKLLDQLRRELGLAMLFVSHDINVVRMVCQRVLVMYLGRVVEEGPVEAVIDRPAHPYTADLVASAPVLGVELRHRTRLSTGEPRSPIDLPGSLCAFEGRCRRASPQCGRTRPQLTLIDRDRAVACFHPVNGHQVPTSISIANR